MKRCALVGGGGKWGGNRNGKMVGIASAGKMGYPDLLDHERRRIYGYLKEEKMGELHSIYDGGNFFLRNTSGFGGGKD